MTINTVTNNAIKVAVVNSDQLILTDVNSALDFIATVSYETGCNRIALHKQAVTEDFFVLSTRLAGETLQKFINYQTKLAIIGDFSHYTSKPLKDFIYESNNGNDIFFVPTEADAIEKLTAAR